jgi:hypothetical protein
MIRAVDYMIAGFFVGKLISEANAWLLVFFVHVRRRWMESALRSCSRHNDRERGEGRGR